MNQTCNYKDIAGAPVGKLFRATCTRCGWIGGMHDLPAPMNAEARTHVYAQRAKEVSKPAAWVLAWFYDQGVRARVVGPPTPPGRLAMHKTCMSNHVIHVGVNQTKCVNCGWISPKMQSWEKANGAGWVHVWGITDVARPARTVNLGPPCPPRDPFQYVMGLKTAGWVQDKWGVWEPPKTSQPASQPACPPTPPGLHDSADARDWAKYFMECLPAITQNGGISEDLMVTWFANAIGAGHDAARRDGAWLGVVKEAAYTQGRKSAQTQFRNAVQGVLDAIKKDTPHE